MKLEFTAAQIRGLASIIDADKDGRMNIRKGVLHDLEHFCLIVSDGNSLSGHLSGPNRGAIYTTEFVDGEATIEIEPEASGFHSGFTVEKAGRAISAAIASAMVNISKTQTGFSTKNWHGFYLVRLAKGKSLGKSGAKNFDAAVAQGLISEEFKKAAINQRFTMWFKP